MFEPLWQLTHLPKDMFDVGYLPMSYGITAAAERERLDPVVGVSTWIAEIVETWPVQLAQGVRCWEAVYQQFTDDVLATAAERYHDFPPYLVPPSPQKLIQLADHDGRLFTSPFWPRKQPICQTCPFYLACSGKEAYDWRREPRCPPSATMQAQ